jgi:hypothetical protein
VKTALRRRGAATVELSLLMIVLIPSILYTMYLEDLLFYKFDLEETVVSSPWDFSNHDYRKNGGNVAGTVRQAAMQTFWDHTSAWNSYNDPNYDAKETVHHEAMAAHQCWLAQGGREIECSMESSVGLLIQGQFIMKNKGGLASCNAILGVQNYFLPEKFFHWWGKVSITGDGNQKMKRHTTGQSEIHAAAKQDPYLYPEMHFGVMADTWALYKTDEVSPDMHPMDSASEFGTWVQIPYGTRSSYLQDANQFADDAIDREFLGQMVKIDGITGDTLITAPVAWKPEAKRTFNSHTASGWDDPDHQSTFNKLENQYMGMPTSTW